ncbi:hypothetical protein MBBAR_8c00200 [Methanobrevibacter arboriphilus JCM 13429 = DSM 1125]|uniref:Uncharacterized protein n=1 Tax=Methanobrevibacter arboriphilus JCM 13429 = DSM 1125 TaxID=1300164 RepID=A0A1V6N2G0_METAZ|nr:hypothetical protein [Methanobrevibacter arboriphilus]OQD58797.1 hypothetical protein MBBAR_8c00200 [Methanobrevibacter arboriphilus JCM 13429 = DSM 1125]
MGFDEWSTGKKVAVILIIVIAIFCVVGAITFAFVANQVTNEITNTNITIGGNNSTTSTISIPQGEYNINIETENSWTSYITTDGRYSQNSGSGSQEIDLGTISNYASITINQQGSGTTHVIVTDKDGKTITEGRTSTDYGSVYMLLRVK